MATMTTSEQHAAMGYLIDAHLAHIRALGHSPRTAAARHNVLRRLHDDLPYGIAYADTAEIQQWLGRYRGWTLYTYDGHARAFYGWADGVHLDGDPMAAIRRPKQPDCIPHPVTDAELAHALHHSNSWWQLVIHLASLEGLRVSEIAGLRREDITEWTVHIRRGKGGSPGTVPAHPHVWQLTCAMPKGQLVRGASGQAVTGHYLSIRAREHFDSIGLPDVHLHRFRDWYATTMLNQGHSIRTVQENLRHKNLASTQGYTKVADGQRRQAVCTLPVLTAPQQDAA